MYMNNCTYRVLRVVPLVRLIADAINVQIALAYRVTWAGL